MIKVRKLIASFCAVVRFHKVLIVEDRLICLLHMGLVRFGTRIVRFHFHEFVHVTFLFVLTVPTIHVLHCRFIC